MCDDKEGKKTLDIVFNKRSFSKTVLSSAP